ncbi:MAG: hypothetical protein ACXVRK_02590 [Gaiellaceae bacterium]
MNRNKLRLGTLAGFSAVIAAALAMLSLVNPSAAATSKPDRCPTNKPLVVDSYATAQNASDFGADGHVWALDAGTGYYRIWSLGGDAYCLQIHDVSTFTTFAGPSPEGTGTVAAGVTGSLEDTAYLRVYGKFAPTVPTTGFIGNFDYQCQQDGTCAGPTISLRRFYFPSGYHTVDPGAFTATYDGGACGTWFQSNGGNTGDIVC